MNDHEVVVIGAGPAGATAAYMLARSGRRVKLCDKARFPRNKPCGEGILPGGVRILENIGLLDQVQAMGAQRFHSIVFHAPAKRRFGFPKNSFGLAVSRKTLDLALLRAAGDAGAEIVQSEVPDLSKIPARFVIDARGTGESTSARFGLSTHVSDRAPSDCVDVFLRNDHEVYTASIEGGRRVVSILGARPIKWRMIEPTLPEWVTGIPEKFEGAPLGADEINFGSGNIIHVGNRLCATDPAAAQGLTLALASAKAAAESIISGRHDFEKRFRARVIRHRRVSRAILFLARHPALFSFPIPQRIVNYALGHV